MEIISRRNAQVIRDLPSARITLTNELIDMGIDIEKDALVVVTLEKDGNKRRIVIEKQ